MLTGGFPLAFRPFAPGRWPCPRWPCPRRPLPLAVGCWPQPQPLIAQQLALRPGALVRWPAGSWPLTADRWPL